MTRWPHENKRPPQTAEEIEGWMEPEELDWLRATITGLVDGCTVIEIGSFKGRSTFAMCEVVLRKAGQMVAVDSWQGSTGEHVFRRYNLTQVKQDFDYAMEKFANQNVLTVLQSLSTDAAAMFRQYTVDMVFVDGEHSHPAVIADIAAWFPKLIHSPQSVLCGHDYNWKSVKAAVDSWGATNQVSIHAGAGTIWYCRPYDNQQPGSNQTNH